MVRLHLEHGVQLMLQLQRLEGLSYKKRLERHGNFSLEHKLKVDLMKVTRRVY